MPSGERGAHTSHGARAGRPQEAEAIVSRYNHTATNQFGMKPLRVMSSIRSNKIKESNRLSLEKASMNIQNVFNHGSRGGVKIKAAALFMNRRSVGRRNNYGAASLTAGKPRLLGIDSTKASRFNTANKSRTMYDNSGRATA